MQCKNSYFCLGGTKINPQNEKLPGVFIAFDKAHSLTQPIDPDRDPSWTYFIKLRSALQALDYASSFVFFLSTTSKISNFVMPGDIAVSTRIVQKDLRTPLPFSNLGFDHLMQNHKILTKLTTIDEVASTECIMHMGQPL